VSADRHKRKAALRRRARSASSPPPLVHSEIVDELEKQRRQTAAVYSHLRDVGELTPLDAMRLHGIERLAARIYDLKQSGCLITKRMVRVTKRDGTVTRVASYRLC
jgi:hypothetical protein